MDILLTSQILRNVTKKFNIMEMDFKNIKINYTSFNNPMFFVPPSS